VNDGGNTPANNANGNREPSHSQYFLQSNNSLANHANLSNPAPIVPTTPTLLPPPPPPTPTYVSAHPPSALTPSSKQNTTAVATPSSTSGSTPRVSFGTHDQIFQWDEQLDLLKHVDEEFFNVAHFLLDVVGVWDEANGNGNGGGVAKEGENYYFVDEEEFQWSDDANNSGHGVGAGIGGLGKKGSKLLTWLTIFNCGQPVSGGSLSGDDYNYNKSSFGMDDGDWSMNSDEKNNRAKKYRLTEKLVKDFEAAVDFRMENISSKVRTGEEESDLVKRTREIARKVKAYGLPKREKKGEDESNRGIVSVGGSYDKSEPSQQPERKRQHDTSYIPRLADFDNDDDEEEEEEEKEKGENDKPNSIKRKSQPLKTKHPSSPIGPYANSPPNSDTKAKVSSPRKSTNNCLFQPFFRSKSSTPSAEECQKRLHQIKHEIENVQKMNGTTKNKAVQAACQKRITKLKDEMRFCQIVKEWHKIRSMMMSSAVEVVKVACKERLKQLVSELETLDLDDEVEEHTVVETEEEEPQSEKAENESEEHEKKDEQEEKENGQWYQRVLQYVQPIDVGGNHRGWDSSMCPIRYNEVSRPFGCQENEGDTHEQHNEEDEEYGHKPGNDTSLDLSNDYPSEHTQFSEQDSKTIEQYALRKTDRFLSRNRMPSPNNGSFSYQQGMLTSRRDYSGSNGTSITTTRKNDVILSQHESKDKKKNKSQSHHQNHRERHNATFDRHVHQDVSSFESSRNHPQEQSQDVRQEQETTIPSYRSQQSNRIHHQNIRPPPIPSPQRGLHSDQRGILTPRRNYPGKNSNILTPSSETSKTDKRQHYNKWQQQQRDGKQHQYRPQIDNGDVAHEELSLEPLGNHPSEQYQSNMYEYQRFNSLHSEHTHSPPTLDQREMSTPRHTNSRSNRNTPAWKEPNATEQIKHGEIEHNQPQSTQQPRKDYRYRFFSGDDDGPVATAVTSNGLEEFLAYIAP